MVAISTSNYSAECWLQYVESLDGNPLCDPVRMVHRCHITQPCQCTTTHCGSALEKAPSNSIVLGHSSSDSGLLFSSLSPFSSPHS